MAKATPANTSPEEQAIRVVVDAWARKRWGADIRAIHELALGNRRIDMVMVQKADIIGIEIKGPRDRLGDGRLAEQIKEFSFYVPEVWLVIDAKWQTHEAMRGIAAYCNVAVHDAGEILVPKHLRYARDGMRDELVCSRLLELLWSAETVAIARRNTVPFEASPGLALPKRKIQGIMARMMTGHQIVKECCAELRNRPLVGMQSDERLDPLADMNRLA